ncbi:MAG: aldolase catalytic domain-containing protein [Bacteroidota bacterium]
MTKIKILDCTLRDGGYYTNWDFNKNVVEDYCRSMELLPVDYVEVGYRSIPLDGYLGEFFYCPEYLLNHLKSLMPSKKLAIILNEKDTKKDDLDYLLNPCKPYIDLVRIAISPKNFACAIDLAKEIKRKGFEVGFNVMYMSDWKKDKTFLNQLERINGIVDYFYMVDSYGGVFPEDIKTIVKLVKSKTDVPIAFHGHNNLEMALVNTLCSIELGCVMVDSTITGMGRGAGNLKTELLLTYLDSKNKLEIPLNELSGIVSIFEKMQITYNWGTSLPYMFSGANSLPQKDVMDWLGLNRYPLSNIITALSNKKMAVNDNIKLPVFEVHKSVEKVIIIGGGLSVKENIEPIKKLLSFLGNQICVIHAGVRYAKLLSNVSAKQYYCLVGSEVDKLKKQFSNINSIKSNCVFPPFPRKMGTVLPKEIQKKSFELDKIDFVDKYYDSPLTIAAQTALLHKPKEIILIGFDGYTTSKNNIQFQLANENQYIIDNLTTLDYLVSSATKTNYRNINEKSIFSYFE